MSEQKDKENESSQNPEKEGHLTCDMPIRYRGHKSEMIPRHGELQSTIKGKDIHDPENLEIAQNKDQKTSSDSNN